MTNAENNKRIVKNTLALYFRQIITAIVALFTSRIVLQTLGVTDYGINNVVGGLVMMLSFLTNSLSATTQRFLSVELGKNDIDGLKQVFANSITLHVIFILLTVVIAETAGLWFLQNKLVIPPDRMAAAFWVFQFSIIAFSVGIFFAPFEGAIMAHERFDFYAKISVVEVVMQLVVVLLLVYLPHDKLVALSFMGVCVCFICRSIIYAYCRKKFEECRIRMPWTGVRIRQLLGYNTYSLMHAFSYILRFQGLNIVLNLYYGPIVNAAQGIANTIYVKLSSFSDNASIATRPQIVMSYTQGDRLRLWELINKSSRLYFYLLLVLTLPFILEMETAIYIWLGSNVEYASAFARLFLFEALLRALWFPINHTNLAVGKLRSLAIIRIICMLMVLASAVLIGINKLPPAYIYVSALVVQGIYLFISVVITLKMQLNFSIGEYVKDVILPITKTSFLAVSLPVVLHYLLSRSIPTSCAIGIFSAVWCAVIIFYIGLDRQERTIVINKLPSFLRKVIPFQSSEQ